MPGSEGLTALPAFPNPSFSTATVVNTAPDDLSKNVVQRLERDCGKHLEPITLREAGSATGNRTRV